MAQERIFNICPRSQIIKDKFDIKIKFSYDKKFLEQETLDFAPTYDGEWVWARVSAMKRSWRPGANTGAH